MTETRVLVTADAHGSEGIRQAQQWANHANAHHIIILGDIWDIYMPMNTPTHYIPGNHENTRYDNWWNNPDINVQNVTLHDDYTQFEIDDVLFGVLGRMDEQSHAHMLTREDTNLGHPANRGFEHRPLDEATYHLNESDIILYHDTPHPYNYGDGPPGGSPYLADVARDVNPRLVYHGHTHERRHRTLPESNIVVRGLPPCDPVFYHSGMEYDYDLLHIHNGNFLPETCIGYDASALRDMDVIGR